LHAVVFPAGAAQFFAANTEIEGNGDGQHINWMEASLEQLTTPLPPWAVRAGARETIYHDPRHTTAAIVTCGGLCPGLNDVVAVRGRAAADCAANGGLQELQQLTSTTAAFVHAAERRLKAVVFTVICRGIYSAGVIERLSHT
jgi:hypothetical protein